MSQRRYLVLEAFARYQRYYARNRVEVFEEWPDDQRDAVAQQLIDEGKLEALPFLTGSRVTSLGNTPPAVPAAKTAD